EDVAREDAGEGLAAVRIAAGPEHRGGRAADVEQTDERLSLSWPTRLEPGRQQRCRQRESHARGQRGRTIGIVTDNEDAECGELRDRQVDEDDAPAQHLDAQWEVAQERQRARAERSEEHTSELQSRENLVCRLLLEK